MIKPEAEEDQKVSGRRRRGGGDPRQGKKHEMEKGKINQPKREIEPCGESPTLGTEVRVSA